MGSFFCKNIECKHTVEKKFRDSVVVLLHRIVVNVVMQTHVCAPSLFFF